MSPRQSIPEDAALNLPTNAVTFCPEGNDRKQLSEVQQEKILLQAKSDFNRLLERFLSRREIKSLKGNNQNVRVTYWRERPRVKLGREKVCHQLLARYESKTGTSVSLLHNHYAAPNTRPFVEIHADRIIPSADGGQHLAFAAMRDWDNISGAKLTITVPAGNLHTGSVQFHLDAKGGVRMEFGGLRNELFYKKLAALTNIKLADLQNGLEQGDEKLQARLFRNAKRVLFMNLKSKVIIEETDSFARGKSRLKQAQAAVVRG